MGPGEEEKIVDELGRGEIRARLMALDPSEIIETRFPDVWLVTHYNSNEEIIGENDGFRAVLNILFLSFSQTRKSRLLLKREQTGVHVMQSRSLSFVLLALVTLLVSPLVLAHSGAGHTAGLADGFMHPANGLDHLLIAIMAGFWAGGSGDHGVKGVVYFLSLLLGGMLLGAVCLAFPQLHLSTTLTVALTVVFVALSIAVPRYFPYIIFGGFAAYHGVAHMLEMPEPVAAVGYMFGLFFSNWLLLMFGLILRQVVITRKPHSHTT